jgi:hypothetical protein
MNIPITSNTATKAQSRNALIAFRIVRGAHGHIRIIVSLSAALSLQMVPQLQLAN